MTHIGIENQPDSDESFSRLLDAYHAALSKGTLAEFWNSHTCSPRTRVRLTEIGAAISDVELFYATQQRHTALGLSPQTLDKKIPGYTIERQIGQGSNGTVYLAVDRKLNRPVAIKVPHSHFAESSSAQLRFRREAEVAASVDHPHILPIFELGTFRNLADAELETPTAEHDVNNHDVDYIVSAYCPGPNLREWLDNDSRSLSFAQAAELVLRLSEGLSAFHARNIVHRDLKPANVMLFPERCVSLPFWPKVTDFGLAKDLDNVAELTLGHECVGTPRYMAPEQLSKTEGNAQTATDVYGLGILLFELLAGRTPFDTDALPVLFDQIRHTQPPGLRSLRSDLPRELEAICAKCLQKQPQQRYATARELADDLQRFLSGQPPLAPYVSSLGHTLKGWKFAVATALVGSLILGAFLFSESLSRPDRDSTPVATHSGIDASAMDGLRFSADNPQVYVAQLPRLESGPFTLEAWICPDYPRGMILNYGGIVSLFSDDGLAWTGPCICVMLPNSPMLFMHAEATLIPHTWSHVACVYDGRALTMYINGVNVPLRTYSEDAQGQRGLVPPSDREPLTISHVGGNGKLSMGSNFPGALEQYKYPYTGALGDVRLSTVARYVTNFVPDQQLSTDADTLSLYRFNQSTNSSVADQGSNSATAHLLVP